MDADELYQIEIAKELEKWDVLGVNIESVGTEGGMIGILVRIDVLVEMLKEANLWDDEVADKKTQEKTLERLRGYREAITPGVQQAKLDAIKNGRLRRQ
jgi:hypothetical protein